MKKFVLATTNKNKIKEIQDILRNNDIQVVAPPKNFDPVENGKSFKENAYIKAFAAAKLMQLPALADDSGLEIDALNGAPGIYSARYADGDSARIAKVLNELKGVPPQERTAQFTCSMVMVAPTSEILFSAEGHCRGIIIDEKRGSNGFGYDPIFYMSEYSKTLAEMTMDEKNTVSHRSKALKQVVEWIVKN